MREHGKLVASKYLNLEPRHPHVSRRPLVTAQASWSHAKVVFWNNVLSQSL
jgi:hypothetical protein